jgi:glutamine amidotransferase
MLAIVDYGAGNLQSVKKALDFIGAASEITADPGRVERAAGVILPGVGSFGDVMASMRSRGLLEALRRAADGTRRFLGICLGEQLLFAASEESPGAQGLGVLPGDVRKIPAQLTDPLDGAERGAVPQALKVPHMGWNSLTLLRKDGLFEGIPDGCYVYFVHSFYVKAANPSHVAAQTRYGVTIDAAVACGLLAATQFHPEKSGDVGLEMLRNFSRFAR